MHIKEDPACVRIERHFKSSRAVSSPNMPVDTSWNGAERPGLTQARPRVFFHHPLQPGVESVSVHPTGYLHFLPDHATIRSDEVSRSCLHIPPPNYRIPLSRLAQAGLFMLQGRPRSLGADFKWLTSDLPVSPVVRGSDNIPTSGPYVVAANHYERPGLWMGWSAMIVARTIYEHTGERLRWIAISEWHQYRLGFVPVPPAITHWIFGRFFDTFGFISMAPAVAGVQERRQGVRAALDAVKAGDAIGIFPEANIGATPAMIEAQPGSGSFVLAMSQRGASIIPLGLFEVNRRLNAVFAPPVDLSETHDLSRADRDAAVRDKVMRAIAALLPEELRGFYA